MKSTAVLPYIKGFSEPLRCCLQQRGVRSVFKSDTTPRSHLVRPKDPVDLRKQDGVVYNAARYTMAKQEGACMNGLRSTLGISGFHKLKLRPFLNTLIRPQTCDLRPSNIHSGLSLFTETLTGTVVELRRPFTQDFTLATSTGTVELRFLKRGCLQSDST